MSQELLYIQLVMSISVSTFTSQRLLSLAPDNQFLSLVQWFRGGKNESIIHQWILFSGTIKSTLFGMISAFATDTDSHLLQKIESYTFISSGINVSVRLNTFFCDYMNRKCLLCIMLIKRYQWKDMNEQMHWNWTIL